MPYVRIEPSGCCERKGLVQVRFCMYLESDDYGYEKHYVSVPDMSGKEYTGKRDPTGDPVDSTDYKKWLDSLPKIVQNNPFHNHFIYVEPKTSDKEIMDIGRVFLEEAYIKWTSGEPIDCQNPPMKFDLSPSQAILSSITNKVAHLKEVILEMKL